MFANRRSAGRQLAVWLQQLREEKPVVPALPRGGVPVGLEIAEGLDVPLDIVLVRKIGVPWQLELALGAVVDGADPQVIINDILAAELAIDQNYIRSETARQLEEIGAAPEGFLGDRTPLPLAGRTVIVVDDGIATGSTVRTALRAIGRAGAGKIVLAVPVAPEDALEELRKGGRRDHLLEHPEALSRRRSALRGIWAACGRRRDLAVGGTSPENGALG
jgi:putative phosphoribosyl transferase